MRTCVLKTYTMSTGLSFTVTECTHTMVVYELPNRTQNHAVSSCALHVFIYVHTARVCVCVRIWPHMNLEWLAGISMDYLLSHLWIYPGVSYTDKVMLWINRHISNICCTVAAATADVHSNHNYVSQVAQGNIQYKISSKMSNSNTLQYGAENVTSSKGIN